MFFLRILYTLVRCACLLQETPILVVSLLLKWVMRSFQWTWFHLRRTWESTCGGNHSFRVIQEMEAETAIHLILFVFLWGATSISDKWCFFSNSKCTVSYNYCYYYYSYFSQCYYYPGFVLVGDVLRTLQRKSPWKTIIWWLFFMFSNHRTSKSKFVNEWLAINWMMNQIFT